ncbi:MAG: SRPBCC family protein [Nocardioidaceae bacterium]
MRLDHQVKVPADVDDVWKFLDDIHAVAACLPGAELTETVDDDRFRGQVKLAIGPLAMNYAGEVRIVGRDDAAHTLRLDAFGRERRGSGTARADITLSLRPDGSATTLQVVSDIALTGRVASLGRGVRDVSNKLFSEFAERLAAQLGAEPGPTAAQPVRRAVPTQDQADVARDVRPEKRYSSLPGVEGSDSIKLAPLVWSVTRERLATFLQRLSDRIRP